MKKEPLIIEELLRLWDNFTNYIIETNPHYVDADFSFNNFISWLKLIGTKNNPYEDLQKLRTGNNGGV